MTKRTLDSFFISPAVKKTKVEVVTSPPSPRYDASPTNFTKHATYPFPIADLPRELREEIELLVTSSGREIDKQPDLDLLYFQSFLPPPVAKAYFNHLRTHLPFYRVTYTTKKFGKELTINTPRFTTVYGLDCTCTFSPNTTKILQSSDLTKEVKKDKYKCQPRPIPSCLDLLRRVTEAATNTTYNFCLVNYYANGQDSISFHSDDEHFLEKEPAIASFSLGAKRDFLMKHKPPKKPGDPEVKSETVKLPLGSGDMVLMRGRTQPCWLHSIPKRKGADMDKGRINITFRKAVVPGGTENYYHYNVGSGPVYKWDERSESMQLWTADMKEI